ncbi:membrane protein YdzA [Fulvivirga imtechensis AK7]|uniref:Membrane protein YdzA n=2 Tax=Fulvivirga TaxID=396811 RepID=L8JPQ0_9BACT|nr:membrane protein YdzA [Fulvivirga imtechensis AK7]
MPLKYGWNIPGPTFYAGMAHGVLFIGYCLWVVIVAIQLKWTITKVFWALIASLLPFGPFVADRKLFRYEVNG